MRAALSTEGLARFSAGRPWLVVAFWIVLLGAGLFLGSGIGAVLTTDSGLTTSSESRQADQLLRERLHNESGAQELVVVRSHSLTVGDPAFRDFVSNLGGRIRALQGVQSVVTWYQAQEPLLVSGDRHTTIVAISLAGDGSQAIGPLLNLLHSVDGRDSYTVVTGGDASVAQSFRQVSEHDLKRVELIDIPVALVVLLVVFGAAVAAGVPIVVSLLSIAVSIGATAVIGRVLGLSIFVTQMILMMGLAVGIDYTLLIVERFREERRGGAGRDEAIARAGATASRAVLFSGLTVIVALAGLLFVPDMIFRSMAVGAIVAVVAAVMTALTLLPATLHLLGDRINALRVPLLHREQRGPRASRFWNAVTGAVMRRPAVSVIISLVILLGAAAPYFTIRLGSAGAGTLPRQSDPRRAFDILERQFTPGMMTPAQIVVDAPNVDAPPVQEAIGKLVSSLRQDPAFGPATTVTNSSGTLALISVPLAGDAAGGLATAALTRLRDIYIPAAFHGSGARALVTGATAGVVDFVGVIHTNTPIVFAFVLGATFLILLVVFRSIVVPLKAILMNLLSVAAAYGLLVLVFQHGVGHRLFGFEQVDRIEAWVPLFLFAVLFGLSMDYHVFLLARIREHFDETRDNRRSVAFGIRSTAGIITGAATIMVAVFSGFAAGHLVIFQQLGFGLAVAVFLDATIVRTVLVPASMTLLGNVNWFLPRWLRWLPTIHVEAARARRPEAASER